MSLELCIIAVGLVSLYGIYHHHRQVKHRPLTKKFQAWAGYMPIFMSIGIFIILNVMMKVDGESDPLEGKFYYMFVASIASFFGSVATLSQGMLNISYLKKEDQSHSHNPKWTLYTKAYTWIHFLWLFLSVLIPEWFVCPFLAGANIEVFVFQWTLYLGIAIITFTLRNRLMKSNE